MTWKFVCPPHHSAWWRKSWIESYPYWGSQFLCLHPRPCPMSVQAAGWHGFFNSLVEVTVCDRMNYTFNVYFFSFLHYFNISIFGYIQSSLFITFISFFLLWANLRINTKPKQQPTGWYNNIAFKECLGILHFTYFLLY